MGFGCRVWAHAGLHKGVSDFCGRQPRAVEQVTDEYEYGVLVKVSPSRLSTVSPRVLRHVQVDEPECVLLWYGSPLPVC